MKQLMVQYDGTFYTSVEVEVFGDKVLVPMIDKSGKRVKQTVSKKFVEARGFEFQDPQ